MNRNQRLARSVIFGLISRSIGSLVVFLVIPVVAHSLTVQDFSRFMRMMSGASLISLIYGAASLTFIERLSSSYGDDLSLKTRQKESSAFFLLTTVGLAALTFLTYLLAPSRLGIDALTILPLSAALFQGLCQWGDTYRVAMREDYISSLWQMGGNISLVIGVWTLSNYGLYAISMLYFFVPAFVQLLIALHVVHRYRPALSSHIPLASVIETLRSMIPVLLNGLIEYLKVFGSGILVYAVSGSLTYATYSALVLLIARLVNPLSLATRPFLPAIVDAIRVDDQEWLRATAKLIITGSLVSLFLAVLASSFIPLGIVNWALPKITACTRLDLVGCALFVYGHGLLYLMTPIYIAARKLPVLLVINASGVSLALLLIVMFPPGHYGSGLTQAGSAVGLGGLTGAALGYMILRRFLTPSSA